MLKKERFTKVLAALMALIIMFSVEQPAVFAQQTDNQTSENGIGETEEKYAGDELQNADAADQNSSSSEQAQSEEEDDSSENPSEGTQDLAEESEPPAEDESSAEEELSTEDEQEETQEEILQSDSLSRDAAENSLDIQLNASQTKAVITLSNVTSAAKIDSILIPVWGAKGGQNDIKWYTATQTQTGTWEATVPIKNHKETGTYHVHIYKKSNGEETYMDKATFSISAITADSVKVVNKNEDKGTFKVEISGINSPAAIKSVQVPVWSEKNGQDDIRWYTAKKSGDNWYTTVDLKYHKYHTGAYNIHVYAEDERGIQNSVKSTTTKISKAPKKKLIVTLNKAETKATVTLYNASYNKSTGVQFPVWGSKDGQNDIKWYKASQIETGIWQAVIPIKNHKESGAYQVHAYTEVGGKAKTYITHSSFKLTNIKAGSITVEKLNHDAGTFQVKIKNITTPASVKEVLVPVWSAKNGQDDIKWYTAKKSGNAWYVKVNNANHNYESGTYHAHVYVKDSRGLQTGVGSTKAKLKVSKRPVLTLTRNSTQTKVTAILKNVPSAGNLKTIYFAVWGSKNGQNDIKWYKASKLTSNTWKCVIKVNTHKESGSYNVHVYKEFTNNTKAGVTTGKFTITPITCSALKIVEKNASFGTYKVKISGISTPAGVASVAVPTWSKKNGQDDIRWYLATKSGNAWYAYIEAYNHNYDTGTYLSHVYVTDERGIMESVGSTSTSVKAVKKRGLVTENGKTYYYNSSYKRATGWQRVNGSRYYFNTSTAVMTTGWAYVDGYKYYFGSNGKLVQDVSSIIGRQSSYQIKVNRQMNCITVYANDGSGQYILPVKSFVCSVGSIGATPLGTFYTNRLGTWWKLGSVYGQYVTQITGNYLFHSAWYYTWGNKYSLSAEEYRKLGTAASHGCVRMTVADAKWIYDYIPNRTKVTIYDSSVVGPFDKPIPPAPAYRAGYGWYCPTDPGL